MPSCAWHAYALVKSNQGSPGADGQSFCCLRQSFASLLAKGKNNPPSAFRQQGEAGDGFGLR
jgi:hypothetical protein